MLALILNELWDIIRSKQCTYCIHGLMLVKLLYLSNSGMLLRGNSNSTTVVKVDMNLHTKMQ